MNKFRMYMQIFNFKKLFMKLFLKNKDTKMLQQRIIYYLPKTY